MWVCAASGRRAALRVIRDDVVLSGVSFGEGSFAGPYNIALEPSRPTVGCYSVAAARGSARALARQAKRRNRISRIGVCRDVLALNRGVVLLSDDRVGRGRWAHSRVSFSVVATTERIGLLRTSGFGEQVRGQVRSSGHARAAARGAPRVETSAPPSLLGRRQFRRPGFRRRSGFFRRLEIAAISSERAAQRVIRRVVSRSHAPSATGSFERRANSKMEPTRLPVRAIMSPRRAAHFERYTDGAGRTSDRCHPGCCSSSVFIAASGCFVTFSHIAAAGRTSRFRSWPRHRRRTGASGCCAHRDR